VETFATYIESETIIKDYEISKDQVVARAMAMVRDVQVKDKKIDRMNSSVFYRISGEINEKEVLESLKKRSNNDIGSIKSSGEYYYGEGLHSSRRKADNQAIDNLITNIADDLQNNFADLARDDDEDLYDFTESIINTYKTSFNRCKKKSEEIKGKKVIFRYIKKTNLQQIFEPRKKKINDYIDLAMKAESEVRIGDALRYYYWALSLLRSHPEHSSLTSSVFDNKLLILSLPAKINSIFNYLSFDISQVRNEEKSTSVTLNVLYKGVDVQSVDYTYYLGDDWSVIISAKSGIGVCDFNGELSNSIKKIKLNTEYRYETKSKIDQELKTVMDDVSQVYFPSSAFEIELNKKQLQPKKKSKPAIKIGAFEQDNDSAVSFQTIDEEIMSKCNTIVSDIIKVIENKKFSSVRKHFTPEGYESFTKIIKYGNAKLLSDKINLKSGQVNDEIVVRSIPMRFRYPNNDFETRENVVFTFNDHAKIDAVSLALSAVAIKDIMDKPERFASLPEKLQLLQFMEYYKTAYCLKQIDYIKQVFADNALIIVGKVLKQGEPIGEMYNKLGNDQVKYIKMKKEEYLDHLELVFKSNEFVNIQFEENVVKKVGGKDKIYGIQIKQHYYSTNYADQGYLFLMMDLNNPKEPKIYVRSWQPQKNADGSVIGLSDFTM